MFVGAELAPNVSLPKVLLLFCGVLELLPNVKSGFAGDVAGLTFAEKLNPPLAGCCDEAEPNVNKEELFDAALVSTGLVVVENIVDVVVALPKADVLFPKAGVLVDPKGVEVALLDGVPNVDRGFAVGELNTGNFVSGVAKIGDLLSVLLPNVGTFPLFSGMTNPGLLPVVVYDDCLSVPNAIVVFDSLVNSGVELETIGKIGAIGVLFTALLVGVVSVAFSPKDTLVDNVTDDVGIWLKDGTVVD